jgi:hypothetical protein
LKSWNHLDQRSHYPPLCNRSITPSLVLDFAAVELVVAPTPWGTGRIAFASADRNTNNDGRTR